MQLIAKRGLVEWAEISLHNMDTSMFSTFINAGEWNALMSAAENNQIAMVKFLLKHGADANAVMSSTNWGPLHVAAKRGNAEVLELLLQAGGDKTIQARHRDFGRDVTVEDVTTDKKIIKLLKMYD